MQPYTTTVPSYPRLGPKRQYKRTLEGYWSGKLSLEEFQQRIDQLQRDQLQTQLAGQLELLPVGDFALYDQVLDTALWLGCVPQRFASLWEEEGRRITPRLYFALARGHEGIPPLEMTKWFDTNYHYLVPELPEEFSLHGELLLEKWQRARQLGQQLKVVLVGPYTFLKLAKLEGPAVAQAMNRLIGVYRQGVQQLIDQGAEVFHLDESYLVCDVPPEEWPAVQAAYEALADLQAKLIVHTSYGGVGPVYEQLIRLPVAGLGLDFVRGREENLQALTQHGFPQDKLLVAGVIDGRNVWRSDLEAVFRLVRERIEPQVTPERLLLSASCNLFHLPEDVELETELPQEIKDGLSFAKQRLEELHLLAQALRHGPEAAEPGWSRALQTHSRWMDHPQRVQPEVRKRVSELQESDFQRTPYAERDPLQRAQLQLPPLPTTTIGSFPQTPELRKARAKAKEDPEGYRRRILEEIKYVIQLQEEIGLDVLVHGEPERNDMVQYFGERLQGCVTTQLAWVQSYGSRCVRPPIIFGDVVRTQPMTLEEAKYAQGLTDKPVKGMLTGPVTILQWSFVREDIPREEVAYQLALAIRDEVQDLEQQAQLRVIQVDEPAFREGLPLRRAWWDDYLRWAVRAFRLATAGVKDTTQIHTHMCYSEFGPIIDAIAQLDADVISIEDARSDGAIVRSLRDYHYPAQIGPGVYDIHSPNIPTVEFMANKIRATLECLPVEQVWVNPDCGLKTRRYEEVIPSLKNMVQAAREVREEVTAKG